MKEFEKKVKRIKEWQTQALEYGRIIDNISQMLNAYDLETHNIFKDNSDNLLYIEIEKLKEKIAKLELKQKLNEMKGATK